VTLRTRPAHAGRPGRAAALASAVTVGLALAVAVLLEATPAAAHDVLTSTSPAAGATLDAPPREVRLTFDQPAIALGTRVLVRGPAGPCQSGPAMPLDDDVVQPLPPGCPAGAYTVSWRVTSLDGHPVSGSFGFLVRASATASATSSSPPAAPSAATSPGAGRTTAGLWALGPAAGPRAAGRLDVLTGVA